MKQYKWWIILGVFVFLIFVGVSTRNGLVSLEEDTNAKWAQVDNQLKRRYDLIPNLVNTVKGVAKQEQDVFGKIADARAQMAGAKTQADTAAASQQMESALARLLVVAENYPQLRSSESFARLMDELAGSENRIAVERQRYNESVQVYNKTLRVFPKNILATLFGFNKKEYFEIKPVEKAAPEVKF